MKKPTFQEDLKRYGPQGTAESLSEEDALAYCRQLARSHYENFSVATFLLPRELRRPFQVVYAYCRWADDLADENDGSIPSRDQCLDLLDWWERGLEECFSHDMPSALLRHPVYRALRRVAVDFSLPKQPFADLLTAFRRDQMQQCYDTFDELLDYCCYSANPVGRIVLHLIYATEQSVPSPDQLAWSDSICTGLQLANFWQDVARDAQIGRCYIPRDFATQYGLEKDFGIWRDGPVFRAMLKDLVRDAREHLCGGRPLITSVPRRFRMDINLFLLGGLAVLDTIEKNGYNVLVRRPIIPRWKKMLLLLRAWYHG